MKGALFDMDGTLTDSMRYWRYAALEYILHHSWPLYQDILDKMLYNSSRVTIPETAQRIGINITTDEFLPELHMYMQRHYEQDVSLKSGCAGMLQRLRDSGVRCMVTTATPTYGAVAAMGRLGTAKYFDIISGYGDVPYEKSRPEYWLACAGRLGTDPEETVVFEDAVYAMRGAKAAGMRVCSMYDLTQDKDREEINRLSDVALRQWDELTPSVIEYLYR